MKLCAAYKVKEWNLLNSQFKNSLIGYALVLKSLVYFLFPEHGLKSLSRVSLEKSWEFVAGSIISIGLSGLLTLMLIL
jgi:hypothetical protein